MRAGRLLAIMLMLQMHQRTTTQQLAQRLEVSERTILRDMEALGMAGVPVISERGPQGGWSLTQEFRTDLNGLQAPELRALFLSPSQRLLSDLGLRADAEAGFIKLLAALPTLARESAQHARRCVHIDGSGWNAAVERVPLLPLMHDAIWNSQQAVMTYERGDSHVVERQVHPLGLVAKGSLWYLVAAVDGQPRSYRASRVHSFQVLAEAVERPDGFDLASFWEESTRTFHQNIPRYPATLHIHADALGHLQRVRFTRVEQVSEPDAQGWLVAQVLFEVEHEAIAVTLSLGAQAIILEPHRLRTLVAREIEHMHTIYTE